MLLEFRVVAATSMLLISLTGLVLNFLVVLRMRREKEGFHKICVNKAFSNVLITMAYIIWAVPCSFLSQYYLPPYFNVFFGQVIGWGPYLMSGPLTQICLAINRFVAINYPHWFDAAHRIPYTRTDLIVLWVTAIAASLPSSLDGCSFIFYPELIAWGAMDTPCSKLLSDLFSSAVITMAFISFSVNVTSILKVVKISIGSEGVIGEGVSNTRRKRRRMMFMQCVIQDCTHTFDCFVNNYLYSVYSAQWFQFLCGSISGLMIILIDGILMSLLHQKSSTPKRTSRIVSTTVITAPNM